MKLVKGFVKTCYSEALIPESSVVAETEREDGSLITGDEAVSPETAYHGGLGLRFKFPGDPKKYADTNTHLVILLNMTQTTRSIKDQVVDNIFKKSASTLPPSCIIA
jgi:hypothetical protein